MYNICLLFFEACGSDTVEPTTVRPDSSAALATALAKSASAKNEPSDEERPDDRALLPQELLSVTDAQEASIEPTVGVTQLYLM